MKIIGLDYSNNSPGLCVSHDFRTFDFVSITARHSISKKNEAFLHDATGEIEGYHCSFVDLNPTRASRHYYENERLKTLNGVTIKRAISSEITKSTYGQTRDTIVAMEGLAMNARGSSLIDLCLCTGQVRDTIVADVLGYNIERFFIFTPGELKNAIGAKGNCGKEVVFQAFLDDPVIPAVRDGDFYKFLSDNRDHEYVRKNDKIIHPWDDLLDAYLCVLKIYKTLNPDEQ